MEFLTFNIPMISIFLSLLSAVVCPLLTKKDQALNLVRIVEIIVGSLSAILLFRLASIRESFTYMMGHFPAPWGNELRAGPLEALLALAFSIVMVLSMTGGAEDMHRDIMPHRQGRYCLLMQLLYTSVIAMVYTNDLFTGYVFIEIAAITACIAVVAKESGHSTVAAMRYFIFSSLGSGLVLMGISILYCITGHLLMEPLQTAVMILDQTGTYSLPLTASVVLMILGLCIKSAQFPFHAWLPDAYSSGTPATSAISSGLVLKGYMVLLLKLVLRVYGPQLISHTHMYNLMFILGLMGMLFTSVSAIRQENVNRMVAYSSAAQISYIFLAFGLGNLSGLAAGCIQILAHAFTKPMIFIGVGRLIHVGQGRSFWSDIRGAGRRAPLAGIAFTVGGLSLCGIPLLAGFAAKYEIGAASLNCGWQTFPALLGLAVSSVLNAVYFIPGILAIWNRPPEDVKYPEVEPESLGQKISLVCFIIMNVALGVLEGPLMLLIIRGLGLFS